MYNTVTILLIEDDDIDARAFSRALRKQGISNPIVRAKDGVEGLEILRETTPEPVEHSFVVLLDLRLPRMNGLEFLTELRADKALRRTLVFVLTTSDDERDKVAAYDQNVAGYITKQAAGTEFLNLVSLLDRHMISVQTADES